MQIGVVYIKYMNKIIAFFIVTFAIAIFSSCNSDIFVDAPEDTSGVLTGTVEGDGGQIDFKVSVKGLEYISFDLTYENRQYCQYYDPYGNLIDYKSPASNIGKIVFDNGFLWYELIKKGNRLIFTSIENPYPFKTTVVIRLDYGFDVKLLELDLLPGKELKLSGVSYSPFIGINESAKISPHQLTVKNDSPSPQTVEIQPYLKETPTVMVSTEYMQFSWLLPEKLAMPVLIYSDGEWKYEEVKDIVPGKNYEYPCAEQFYRAKVEIPANTTSTVYYNVKYSRADAAGTFIFVSQVSGRRVLVGFTCSSYYPVKYDVKIENAK